MKNFSIAVMFRPGSREDAIGSKAATYGADLYIHDPKNLAQAGAGWCFIDNEAKEESSTAIKRFLQAGQRNIPSLSHELESYIVSRGLYETRAAFSQAAQSPVAPINNNVRFQAFLNLANVANLIKAIDAKNGSNLKPIEMVRHAAACWDKSKAKGDFNKPDDVPGELADDMISLSWLASVCNVPVFFGAGRETHLSVAQWCDTNYAGLDIKERLLNTLEELTELCVCEGMERQRMLNLLTIVFTSDDIAEIGPAFARCVNGIEDYAASLGFTPGRILDDKMQINRARTIEQSELRLAAKRAIFDRGPI